MGKGLAGSIGGGLAEPPAVDSAHDDLVNLVSRTSLEKSLVASRKFMAYRRRRSYLEIMQTSSRKAIRHDKQVAKRR